MITLFFKCLFLSLDDKINSENLSSDNMNSPNTSSSIKDEFVISKEEGICIAGPSTIVFETSISQSPYSQGKLFYINF